MEICTKTITKYVTCKTLITKQTDVMTANRHGQSCTIY